MLDRVFGLGPMVKFTDQGYWLGLGSNLMDWMLCANRLSFGFASYLGLEPHLIAQLCIFYTFQKHDNMLLLALTL